MLTCERRQEELRQEHAESRARFRDRRWRDVDALEDRTRDASARAKKNQDDMERLVHKQTFLQEGILHLCKMAARTQGEADPDLQTGRCVLVRTRCVARGSHVPCRALLQAMGGRGRLARCGAANIGADGAVRGGEALCAALHCTARC